MTRRPRSHSSAPRIPQIVADLRARIAADEFTPNGGKLPSTVQLAEHYKINQQAIFRVISLLKADGTVWSRQGAGVYAREWKPLAYRPQSEYRRKAPDLDVFRSLIQAAGRLGQQTIEVVEIAAVDADESIKQRLKLEDGELVAVRRRTSFIDDRPYFTDDSFVPLRIVEGSEWMAEGSVGRGTNQVLAELGHELVRALDELYPRMARPVETERLGLGKGGIAPVVELITTGHDAQNVPIQVTRMVLPGDRNVIVYERTQMGERQLDGER